MLDILCLPFLRVDSPSKADGKSNQDFCFNAGLDLFRLICRIQQNEPRLSLEMRCQGGKNVASRPQTATACPPISHVHPLRMPFRQTARATLHGHFYRNRSPEPYHIQIFPGAHQNVRSAFRAVRGKPVTEDK